MKKKLQKVFFITLWFEKLTIRSKIISVTMIMILFPVLFSAMYFYSNLSSVLTSNEYENLNQQINKTVENIESSFSILDNTSFHLMSSKNIRDWLSNDEFLSDDKLIFLQKRIEMESDLKYSMLFNSAWDLGLISTAYLFINEEIYIMISKNPLNISILNQNNINVYRKISSSSFLGKQIVPPSTSDETIYFTRTISKPGNPQEPLRLIIGTEESVISQKYEDLTTYPGSIAYIVNNEGIIFSSPDKNTLGNIIKEDIYNYKNTDEVKEMDIGKETFFVASREIGESGLTFICAIPKEKVMSDVSETILSYFLITLFILLIFLLLGIIVSVKSTNFISTLLENINNVKSGNYSSRMPAYKTKELNELSDTFNNMTNEIEYLVNQVYEKQLLLKETDIKFLQSQMNPHFLFNVLVTIGMKARMLKDETVYKMIDSLSELLQAGIYSNKETKITIRQELEYVQFYLYLQKMRFEDNLQYEINVYDNSILNLYIPKFCIEPIVENAVSHGIENSGKGGFVKINVFNRDDSIIIEIIDNGAGFNTDSIDIQQNVNRKKSHNSIGLKNTNQRIKLIYGELYGIKIVSSVGNGCKVTIKIPVDNGDETDV